MLTNNDVYSIALSYFGLEDPSHADAGLNERIRRAFNWAFQRLFSQGPEWLRQQDFAAVIRAPRVINNLVVTQYGTATSSGDITTDMVGSSLRIAGEMALNELTSTTSLLRPILQPSCTTSATQWGDCVLLPPNFIGVAGNVFLDGTSLELQPLFYRGNQIYKTWPHHPLDGYGVRGGIVERFRVGRPIGYWVQPANQLNGTGINQQRLRVWPQPDADHTVQCEIEIGPPEVQLADLQTTNLVSVPVGWHESIFLPLVLINLSQDPHFLPSKKAGLETEESVLQTLGALDPQPQGGEQMRLPYRIG